MTVIADTGFVVAVINTKEKITVLASRRMLVNRKSIYLNRP